MKKKIYLGGAIAALTSILATPTLIQAQTSIADLQRSPGVTISGKVVGLGEADENEWVLDDGTATVVVDAGPRRWREIKVSPGDRLTVVGEMDGGEFDAFSLTKADGTVVKIRPAEGPPPWAGK
jgi:hypothetical protein